MSAAADTVDPATKNTQAKATDPASSAWVAANAGSGKTYVLSRRVIRLLLRGTDPARILCLTFTKAAAAEMANRVFAELGAWTTLGEADLGARIADLEGTRPSPETIAAARRLFAEALDTPGGLKIQTIHAFCERLLHQFPLEANVAGHFEVVDDRGRKALTEEAQKAAFARAAAAPRGLLGQALRTVLSEVSDFTLEASLLQFINARTAIGAWIVARDTLTGAIAELREELAVAPGETTASRRAAVIDETRFTAADGLRLLNLLRASSKQSDGKAAGRMAPFVEAADEDARIDCWLSLYFKDNGEPYQRPVTNDVLKAWPGLDEMLTEESARLAEVRDRILTVQLFETSVAMLTLGEAAIGEYERLKNQRGLLDFEDLIVRTATLLSRPDASSWVHYKLDRGIDHILVDEAQDTSPAQWQVIRALVEEFFAGEGASPGTRTLFAVGDEKQSIYSFQGAVPAMFAIVQKALGGRARAATYAWEDLELHLSFRSVPKILEAVDAVFSLTEAHRGLTAEPRPTEHTARRRDEPGRVIVWPSFQPPAKPEPDDWVQPVDYLGEQSPEVKLAKRIAGTIRGWLKTGEMLDAPDSEGKPHPIRAGGILILLRSRGALTDAINRELKTNGVPIAGADRLMLTEHIAVMDLMALGAVVLLPEDDLSLAALLKSPLVGLGEDALYDLAYGRGAKSLWEALIEKANERADFAGAKAKIDTWRAAADQRDPHAFFAAILGPERGREAFLRRLGAEAEDILDEFLAQTLAYEKNNTPSLEGFLAWLVAGDIEVKRDTETLRDEVRVMTVHGAKGLEADVVFLIDNGTFPVITGYDRKALPVADNPDPLAPGPLVWMRGVKTLPLRARGWLDRERARDDDEYRRLLYVGMTRARDRLYIAGIDKTPNRKDDNRWHALVSRALESEWENIGGYGDAAEYEWRRAPSPVRTATAAEPGGKAAEIVLPDWAKNPAPAPPPALVRMTPSTALGAVPSPAPGTAAGAEQKKALARGSLLHRLLQSLPDVPQGERSAIGTRYLAVAASEWSEDERSALLAETLAILDHPDFAPVFAKGSRAEVDIAGRIGGSAVSGRIDRLAVTADRVLIVDYKTNRPVPDVVPPGYVTQLALYRAILKRLYPGKAVAAAILWTERPALTEIAQADLIRAESALSGG